MAIYIPITLRCADGWSRKIRTPIAVLQISDHVLVSFKNTSYDIFSKKFAGNYLYLPILENNHGENLNLTFWFDSYYKIKHNWKFWNIAMDIRIFRLQPSILTCRGTSGYSGRYLEVWQVRCLRCLHEVGKNSKKISPRLILINRNLLNWSARTCRTRTSLNEICLIE